MSTDEELLQFDKKVMELRKNMRQVLKIFVTVKNKPVESPDFADSYDELKSYVDVVLFYHKAYSLQIKKHEILIDFFGMELKQMSMNVEDIISAMKTIAQSYNHFYSSKINATTTSVVSD